MIGLPAGTRIWLVAGVTDMRRGMDGLAALVQGAIRSRGTYSSSEAGVATW